MNFKGINSIDDLIKIATYYEDVIDKFYDNLVEDKSKSTYVDVGEPADNGLWENSISKFNFELNTHITLPDALNISIEDNWFNINDYDFMMDIIKNSPEKETIIVNTIVTKIIGECMQDIRYMVEDLVKDTIGRNTWNAYDVAKIFKYTARLIVSAKLVGDTININLTISDDYKKGIDLYQQ